MSKTAIILLTLVGYQLLLVSIGLWAQRRTRSSEDFFLGGRRLGPVVAALSYSASASSAWTLLGVSGITYVLGVGAVWLAVGATLGAAVAWTWVAPRMRVYSRTRQQLTLTDFLAEGSSGAMRRALTWSASAIILVSFLFYIAAQFQGAGHSLASTFDLSPGWSITLGGGVVMFYTFLGGFWAVSLTDAVQGVLMAAAALVLPIAGLVALGGWDGLLAGLRAGDAAGLSLGGPYLGLAAVGFIVGQAGIGLSAQGQPHLLVRFMAVADDRALRQARLISIGWYCLVFTGMVLLGLEGRVLFPALPQPETVFFALTHGLFPPLAAGVLLAAALSAILSTADSQLLVAASALGHDLGGERRGGGQGGGLRASRLAVLVLVLLAVLVAVYLPATIFERVLFAWVAVGAAFGPMVFVRLAGVSRPPAAVLASMLTGFLLAVLLYLLPDAPGDIAERLLPFAAALTLLLLWPAGTLKIEADKHDSNISHR